YACNLTGSVGKCTQAAAGGDPRGLCGMMGGQPGCKATCNAAGFCAYPGASVLCGTAASCVGSASPTILTASQACDGKGSCVDQPSVDCSPYNCVANACPTSCSDDSFCSTGNKCGDTPPTCGGHRPPGAKCTLASDCESGFCADGVCCTSACTGACQRCDLPPPAGGMADGQCRVPVGSDPDAD